MPSPLVRTEPLDVPNLTPEPVKVTSAPLSPFPLASVTVTLAVAEEVETIRVGFPLLSNKVMAVILTSLTGITGPPSPLPPTFTPKSGVGAITSVPSPPPQPANASAQVKKVS